LILLQSCITYKIDKYIKDPNLHSKLPSLHQGRYFFNPENIYGEPFRISGKYSHKDSKFSVEIETFHPQSKDIINEVLSEVKKIDSDSNLVNFVDINIDFHGKQSTVYYE